MAEKKEFEEKREFDDRPILESSFRKSKDGRYLIHRVTITTIKPVKYIEKVLQCDDEGEKELELLGEK